MSALFDIIKFTNLDNWSVSHLLENQFQYNKNYKLEKIGSFLIRNKTKILIDDNTQYRRVKIKLYNKGVLLRDTAMGRDIGTKKQFIIKKGQFLLSKIDARNGAFGLATDEVNGAIITADFFAYDIDTTKIEPYFLVLLTTTKKFQQFAQSASSGTTGRQRIDEKKFLDVKIPLPPLNVQKRIVNNYQNKINLAKRQEEEVQEKEIEIKEYLYSELNINKPVQQQTKVGLLSFINFVNLQRWDIDSFKNKFDTNISIYPLVQYASIFKNLKNGADYRKYTKKGIHYIKVSNIKNFNIDFNSSSKIQSYKEKDLVPINTLLITRKGSVGRSAFFKENIKIIASSEVFIIELDLEKINSDYFLILNESTFIQSQYQDKYTGMTMPNITQPNLKSIQIPLPSIEIQNKIVAYISIIKSLIENLTEKASLNKRLALVEFEKEIFYET